MSNTEKAVTGEGKASRVTFGSNMIGCVIDGSTQSADYINHETIDFAESHGFKSERLLDENDEDYGQVLSETADDAVSFLNDRHREMTTHTKIKQQFQSGDTWKVTRHDPRMEIYANDGLRCWPEQTTIETRTVIRAGTRCIYWTQNRHTDWPKRADVREIREGFVAFVYPESGIEMTLERQ